MDKVDRYIEHVQHLPPASAVLARLAALSGDPNRDIDRIAELIIYDPSLTAEILKRCNSAFFRGAEPASDVVEAVSRLGFIEVDQVVGARVGAQAASPAWVEDALDAGSLWRHSVTTAVAAATLAGRVQQIETEAFTAGLLHDVGKLVFASVKGTACADSMRQAGISGSALALAEEAALGATHADVGARLLARWGLPGNITLAVLHHHHSPYAAAPFEQLAATVHLANSLAHHMTGAPGSAPEPTSSSPDAMTLLQLTAQDISTIEEQAQERLRRVQRVLQITV